MRFASAVTIAWMALALGLGGCGGGASGGGDGGGGGGTSEEGGNGNNGNNGNGNGGGGGDPQASNEVNFGPAFGPGPAKQLGASPVGTPLVTRIPLHNDDDVARTIVALRVTGDNAGDFQIAAGDCQGEIAPDGICTMELTFTPAEQGTRRAILSVDVQPPNGRSLRIEGQGGVHTGAEEAPLEDPELVDPDPK
jgi:hypothetical protein